MVLGTVGKGVKKEVVKEVETRGSSARMSPQKSLQHAKIYKDKQI